MKTGVINIKQLEELTEMAVLTDMLFEEIGKGEREELPFLESKMLGVFTGAVFRFLEESLDNRQLAQALAKAKESTLVRLAELERNENE